MSLTARGDPVGSWVEEQASAGRLPGAAWWIEGPGGPVSQGAAGRAVLEPKPEPAHEGVVYDLASLTKPLATAWLALLLEGERALSLDDGAGAWLPELAESPYAGVVLRDFATHRAGLPTWHPLYLEASDRDGFVRAIAALPPAGAPGETRYSDPGYILLGVAIERAGGTTLERLFAERIAAPLDLRDTGFATNPRRFAAAAPTEMGNAYERALAGPRGAGHRWREHLLRGEVHDANAHALGGVAGHAGLFGPVAEVAILAREILRPSRTGPGTPARRALLVADRPGGTRTVGFQRAADSDAARGLLPDDAVGHVGFTGTSVWLDPAGDRFFVLLTNRVHPQVPTEPFHPVRREFHRLALAMTG